ncbi:Ig-like domain-containing protein [Microbacterium hydrocarbonoxydans]|uniref:Ig-like domain-containing protein n=1 Tax=Microbacterium hydrocarbonoxydans TaxID=273678 RepID=UPI001FBB7894|nr:Ig-like domain-containing protein [Microbacterium hydrocarbonoxydans]
MIRSLRATALTALACLLVAASALAGPAFSSAAFTTRTANTATASAASDWTPPSVSVQDPGTALKGTVTLAAVASDAESGVKSVTLSVQAVGAGTWTTLCTATAAPYGCAWDTRAVTDGAYDVRAVAVDGAGYSTTSATVHVTVSNAFGVTLAAPADIVRGSVQLSATLQNAGIGVYTVRIEYAVAGSGSWKSLCLNLLAPFSCSWATASFANGFYDLRAVATQGLSTSVSPVVADVLVDNAAPSASMIDPGTPLSGTVTLAASASDADSGVASVAIQYAPTGGSTWATACTVTTPPYSCRFGTTTLAGGSYAFRAVATDAAGNSATSSAVTNRIVDNTISSVSAEDPGAYLHGTTALTASASSTAGIASVTIQYAPGGTGSWATACTPTSVPYSCAWVTTGVADGLYDLRAVLVDGTGKQTVSATVTGRRVDNTPVRGADVQTANGGATAGRVDAGDTLTFTYGKPMLASSISPGWNGTALPVTLRLRDGALLGLGGSGDTVDVLRSGAAVNLGSVNLRGDYVKAGKTSTFNATMVATTATVNGAPVTVVTVTVGSLHGAGALRTATVGAAMTWTPSATATDGGGAPCSTAPVTEVGALDREF